MSKQMHLELALSFVSTPVAHQFCANTPLHASPPLLKASPLIDAGKLIAHHVIDHQRAQQRGSEGGGEHIIDHRVHLQQWKVGSRHCEQGEV